MSDKYVEKLKSVLYSDNIDERETDPRLDASISFCRLNRYRVFVYGAGKDVDAFVDYLKHEEINICGIFDRDNKRTGKLYGGIEVVHAECIREIVSNDTYIFVYSMLSNNDKIKLDALLTDAGIRDWCYVGESRYSILGMERKYAEWNHDWRVYFREKEKELIKSICNLSDTPSKMIFVEYIRAYMELSSYRYPSISPRYKYFFGDRKEALYQHIKDEVWINFGADEGGTIANFFWNGLSAMKIYAVDGDSDNIAALDRNRIHFKKKNAEIITPVQCYVDGSGSLKEYLAEKPERMTLINADILLWQIKLAKSIKI